MLLTKKAMRTLLIVTAMCVRVCLCVCARQQACLNTAEAFEAFGFAVFSHG